MSEKGETQKIEVTNAAAGRDERIVMCGFEVGDKVRLTKEAEAQGMWSGGNRWPSANTAVVSGFQKGMVKVLIDGRVTTDKINPKFIIKIT